MDVTAILPVPAGLADRADAVLTPVAGDSQLVRVVRALGELVPVLVATAPVLTEAVTELVAAHGFSRVPVVVAAAPGDIAQCVAAALAHDLVTDAVLVHDVGWPLVDPGVVDRLTSALRAGARWVVPARPVTDSIKVVGDDGAVVATLDRAELEVMQYPRGFAADVLRRTVDGAAAARFDDLDGELSARATLELVAGDPHAFGVELPRDADYLAAVIASRQSDSAR
ncbi:4-diphosphocytidyl-2C-methyl-D-erythritol kinase [Mycolicibacterium sp. 018/SC-01/001]|uniref:IspD/TarI family cytidylyltransferase n=1 Tax=Mycolicibacterium sp. 018/SC-01/001 TaxID=2592069 RepID=UPI0011809BA5|nr:2-C-methyl-D-erythritol 4-phosphate cytidylyltransferase [Mycolicibacterium sp. 018/SC-01/001]TRW78850.1 4-diphosphocytidyl-2C-methyl-D-erythritol kinase [Mycolicibacterium sp. 018/SC-01/001]